MDSFSWVASEDPHNAGETRIAPAWTLDVQPDGSIVPRMPRQVVLRDAGDLRPVAPFIELWCEEGPDGQPDSWTRGPLKAAMLLAEGLNMANLTFTIEAMNVKAARRTLDPDLRFGTFPQVQIFGDQHVPQTLLGVSPPTATTPMIPSGRSIPLGRIQVIRPSAQPPAGSTPWDGEVDVNVVRLRFTPPRGEFYGPTAIAGTGSTVGGTFFPLVPAANAFLDGDAGWLNAEGLRAFIAPADTFDGAEQPGGRSLGIVDDTCEVRITVTLDRSQIGRDRLEAHANVFSGPPDYAPDRRPFLSLADDLNDRSSTQVITQRDEDLTDASRDRWVEDLFERAFETISMMNVDLWRFDRGAQLEPGQLRPAAIPDDKYPDPTRAMGSRDALRDGNIAIEAPSDNIRLPLSDRARDRHRGLSDIIALKNFIRENPTRLRALVRGPFSAQPNENGNATTMQMPPFMRASSADPLTLTNWQYNLLMAWADDLIAGPELLVAFATRREADTAARAARRRTAVLARLDTA